MKLAFLFQSDPVNKKIPDQEYEKEFQLLSQNGIDVFLISLNDIDGVVKVIPSLNADVKLIYRGWMLNESEYDLIQQKTNNSLLVSKESYYKSHYIKNWYKSVEGLTMKTFFDEEINQIKFDDNVWFVKDNVKSCAKSVVKSKDDLMACERELLSHRGKIEGGLVCRQFKNIVKDSEKRYFVFNGNVYEDPNFKNEKFLSLVSDVAKRHKEVFFSVDVVDTVNGDPILIEIGDGQVSDVKHWDLNDFVSNVLEPNVKVNDLVRKLKV